MSTIENNCKNMLPTLKHSTPYHNFLLWSAVVAVFLGSVFGINFFGISFFPLRIIAILAFPTVLLLFKNNLEERSVVAHFSIIFLSLLPAYGALTLLWSPDPGLGIKNLGILVTGIILFLLLNLRPQCLETIKKIMALWALLSIFMSLLGFYEFFSGKYLFEYTDEVIADTHARRSLVLGWFVPKVIYSNSNNFAFVNALSFFLLLGWAIGEKSWFRFLGFAAASMGFVLTLISISRAAIVGIFMGLLVMFFLWLLFENHRRSFFVFFVLLCFSMSLSLGSLVANLSSISYFNKLIQRFVLSDHSKRLFYYTRAIQSGTYESCTLGNGLGSSTENIQGDSYHHFYLEIFAELGLWAFMGHLMLLFLVVYSSYKTVKKNTRRHFRTFHYGIIASCVAMPVLLSGPSSVSAEGVYWLWLGLIVAFNDSCAGNINNKLTGMRIFRVYLPLPILEDTAKLPSAWMLCRKSEKVNKCAF